MNEVTACLVNSQYCVQIPRPYTGCELCGCYWAKPPLQTCSKTYEMKLVEAEEFLKKRAWTNWPGYYCYGNKEHVRKKFHGA
jgi:hypothetical protein